MHVHQYRRVLPLSNPILTAYPNNVVLWQVYGHVFHLRRQNLLQAYDKRSVEEDGPQHPVTAPWPRPQGRVGGVMGPCRVQRVQWVQRVQRVQREKNTESPANVKGILGLYI